MEPHRVADDRMSDMEPRQDRAGERGFLQRWIDGAVDFLKGPPGILAGVMALLALLGTGVTLADAAWARTYWLMLVPVYGVLCVTAAWYRTGQFTGSVMRQILHWLSVAAAIALDFAYLGGSGTPGTAGTGLSSLLILALGSLLAGIHLEWLFALVGILLFAIFALVGLAHQYVTLTFLIAAAAVLVLLAYWALRRR